MRKSKELKKSGFVIKNLENIIAMYTNDHQFIIVSDSSGLLIYVKLEKQT